MKILNKNGLTIAEAVIAMVLLAVVTVGIYGVIMASVRSGRKPDTREDMAYVIETASAKIKELIKNSAPLCVKWDVDGQGKDMCILFDNCISFDASGACAARSACSVEVDGVTGCPYTSATELETIRQALLAGGKDICGDPLLENTYIRDSNTQSPVGADTPFDGGKDYHIERCLLPASCPAGSEFYYTAENVGTPGAPRYNIQFHIDCVTDKI